MSIQSHASPSSSEGPWPVVPPLETGDCLSRAEFEQRYAAMPHLKKAELVGGVVYVPSPVAEPHAMAHARLMTWLGVFAALTPGMHHADNATVRLDHENELQPDALLRITHGGQSSVGSEHYIEGPPELVAEVAATTASRDLHSKLDIYRRHGVREYLVWRVFDAGLDWFQLDGTRYVCLTDEAGLLRSRVFPGLWLDRGALLRGDMARVLAVVQQGIASSEHAELVARVGRRPDTQ